MRHAKQVLAAVLALGLLTACGGGTVSNLSLASLGLAGDGLAARAPTTTFGSQVGEISLADTSIRSDDPAVMISSSDVTITAGGSYRLSGTLSDGVIAVDAGNGDTVTLLFDGVDITNLRGPALKIESAESVVIELAPDTSNHLVDGVGSLADAVVSSAADLKINGDGGLTIRANSGDGISAGAGLAITGGTIGVMAHEDGVVARDYLVLGAPDLTINADGTGMMTTRADDPELGYISIAGGRYTIDVAGDAIVAGTGLYIYAGEFEFTTIGASVAASPSGVDLP